MGIHMGNLHKMFFYIAREDTQGSPVLTTLQTYFSFFPHVSHTYVCMIRIRIHVYTHTYIHTYEFSCSGFQTQSLLCGEINQSIIILINNNINNTNGINLAAPYGELTMRGDLGALELVLEQLVALLGVIDQRLQRLLCPCQGLGFGGWGLGFRELGLSFSKPACWRGRACTSTTRHLGHSGFRAQAACFRARAHAQRDAAGNYATLHPTM
jgi:hypothetical protein